jgi:hypothetical protein
MAVLALPEAEHRTAGAASRRLPSPNPAERNVLSVAAGACITAVWARPSLLQLTVNPHLGWLFPVAAVVFTGTVVVGALSLAGRPDPAYVAVSLTVLLSWAPLFVFRSPYRAVAGITIAHGVLYVILVATVTLGTRGQASSRLAALGIAVYLLIVGAGLSVASHLHASGPGLRAIYGAYLGLVVSHFLIDGVVWRLRDPRVKRILTPRMLASSPATDRSAAELG